MKIAVVGLGSIGKRHAANLLEMGGHELLGCDVMVGQEGYETGLTIQCVSDIAMVWEWGPDAVLICTPPESHYELSDGALSIGAFVFCEKPLATTSKLSEGLLIRGRNRIAIGYQLRWQLMDFRDLCWSRNVRFYHGQNMAAWPSQYKKDVLEEFSHEIDAAVFVNGPVQKVSAIQSNVGWLIQLQHVSSWSTVVLEPCAKSYHRFATREDTRIVPCQWTFDKDKNDQAYKDEVAAFIKVCQGGPWDERLCSAAQAVHVVRIIDACRESARECRVVTI